jgi:tRNA1(Val) A37 N6-methylase TrmN6
MNPEEFDTVKKIYSNDDTNKRQQIHDFFQTRFIIENVKRYGEISTPCKLVDEMIDLIHPEFWCNYNTILEPCCGKGNFVLALFDKFFNSMIFLNEEQRVYTIINKLLHFGDINGINVEICIQLLELHSKYLVPTIDISKFKFNCFVGNSLEIVNDKYNSIVTNPPYNSDGITKGTLYQQFIIKSLNEWIKEDGYILFVTPNAWRKIELKKGKSNGIFKLMTETNHMIEVVMNSEKEGLKTFNCGTPFDYYLIQKTESEQNTLITDYNGVLQVYDLKKNNFLPNYYINEVFDLINSDTKVKMVKNGYDSRSKLISKIEDDIFQFLCIHSTPKNGVRYMYSNCKDRGNFGVSKVIFGRCGKKIQNVVIDIEGTYGLTEGASGIEISSREEGELIKDCLMSENWTRIMGACLWSNYLLSFEFFELLRNDFYK